RLRARVPTTVSAVTICYAGLYQLSMPSDIDLAAACGVSWPVSRPWHAGPTSSLIPGEPASKTEYCHQVFGIADFPSRAERVTYWSPVGCVTAPIRGSWPLISNMA